ncbi:MAG: ATP-binding protein [Candidatus Amulumruptor caecigallinarius]|nr:ATP-binding protein [Candidatus Amulumruptor caecigallinarius]MCM1397371.1 ATP-binding protein [Candidatus Amulumruptor caecigallinarius]MCM1454739.1 ATP-binding protein [bacterium]
MKFYDREIETQTLRNIEETSRSHAQMTVITGRRRIGKTTLIKHAYAGDEMIYFFVARKSETLLCAELADTIREQLGEDIGGFDSMARLFAAIMQIAKRRHFTLVFDEFQNFKYVNEAFFSDMQNLWDSSKEEARINLIVCGSLYSMMTKIFDDRKEPLYGRATSRMRLRAFPLRTLADILHDNNPGFISDDLLAFYMISGGVAKYVEQLVHAGAFTKDAVLDHVLSFGSYFIDEGKELLSDEFGKDYGNYFSILSAIASGFNERGEIKSYTGIEAGGYLDKLENTYDLLYRYRPYLASPNSRNVKYGIKDNFLNFWFRFIYKYRSAVEIGNLTYVLGKVRADYDTYSGWILERYFRQLYRETGLYNVVTNYWEKGGLNEIDLVAVNEADREIVIGEVKRNRRRIDLHALEHKAAAIMQKQKGWKIGYAALSLDDMIE